MGARHAVPLLCPLSPARVQQYEASYPSAGETGGASRPRTPARSAIRQCRPGSSENSSAQWFRPLRLALAIRSRPGEGIPLPSRRPIALASLVHLRRGLATDGHRAGQVCSRLSRVEAKTFCEVAFGGGSPAALSQKPTHSAKKVRLPRLIHRKLMCPAPQGEGPRREPDRAVRASQRSWPRNDRIRAANRSPQSKVWATTSVSDRRGPGREPDTAVPVRARAHR